MCGRYFIEQSFTEAIEHMTGCAVSVENTHGDRQEVFPTDKVPVLCQRDGTLQMVKAVWGYPHWEKKNVLINARSETVQERRMFQSSIKYRRCVVPVSGYYEWNARKVRHQFTRSEACLMFLAGIYQGTQDDMRFVILTTAANESVAAVHHRMPLVLERDELDMWLSDPEAYRLLLGKRPPALMSRREDKKKAEYEQLSLFE